jgi:hypothetical protein
MSSTEIVFRGDEAMEIGKALDIRLVLPRPGNGRRGATIVSKAKVTRSWLVSETPEQAFTSAVLIGPRLLHFSPESRSREPEPRGWAESATGMNRLTLVHKPE